MKGRKCFGLLLALSIIFGVSFVVSPGVSALKHEYDMLPILNPALPLYSNSTNNYFDWNSQDLSHSYTPGGVGFDLRFENDAWNSSYNDLRVNTELRFISPVLSDGSCRYNGTFSEYSTPNNSSSGVISQNSNTLQLGYGNLVSTPGLSYVGSYVPDFWNVSSCKNHHSISNFDSSSADYLIPGPYPSTPNPSDLSHASGGYYNPLDLMTDDGMADPPRFYKTGAIPFTSSHKASNGVVYDRVFSFDKLFNRPITSFSYLRLGLWDYSGYWSDDSNLYSGRHFDFNFNFRFYNPVEFTSNFQSNGSIQLSVAAVPKSVSSSNNNNPYYYYDCTSTFRNVQLENETAYYWDISCPVDLEEDYIAFVPSLVINGNGYNVLNTTSGWDFSSLYIISDFDSTPGDHFNSDSSFIGTDIWDKYWQDNDPSSSSDGGNWFDSLTNMFTFGFFNPFAPLFQMFSDNNSCASIPTIAGMIHSEETEVCPWFASSTRNVVTPVLGLSSMMLVFGFAVRWLGSSSGNLFEDSRHEEVSNQGGRWGHFRKGGS